MAACNRYRLHIAASRPFSTGLVAANGSSKGRQSPCEQESMSTSVLFACVAIRSSIDACMLSSTTGTAVKVQAGCTGNTAADTQPQHTLIGEAVTSHGLTAGASAAFVVLVLLPAASCLDCAAWCTGVGTCTPASLNLPCPCKPNSNTRPGCGCQ